MIFNGTQRKLMNTQGMLFSEAEAKEYYGARYEYTPLSWVSVDKDGNVVTGESVEPMTRIAELAKQIESAGLTEYQFNLVAELMALVTHAHSDAVHAHAVSVALNEKSKIKPNQH